MRDNAPSHISNKTTEFIKNIKIKECEDWPPYIPDLNLIENIFGVIKSQLMKKEINKRSELILEINNAYDSISDEVITNLNESFSSKLQQWIENEGDWISY